MDSHMDPVTPGMGGGNGALARRVAALERQLQGVSKIRLWAKAVTGEWREYVAMAIRGGPRDGDTGSGASLTGAFCRQFIDDDGNTMLQGGTITGGHGGSAVVDDEELIAAGDTPPIPNEGDRLYLKVNCTATAANGMMLPGLQVNTAELTPTLGTAHAFTTTALTGDLFVEVGRWTSTEFLPSGSACGASKAGGCFGSYRIGNESLD
jgi:hypothetical protein